jgi:hypothetical protein
MATDIQWLHTAVWEAILTFEDDAGPIDLTGANIKVEFAKAAALSHVVAEASTADGSLILQDQSTSRGKVRLAIMPEDRSYEPTAPLTDIVGDFLVLEGGEPKWRGRLSATIVRGTTTWP